MLTKLLCEFGATALMIVFGVGVHCDTVLKGTKYQGSGHMFAITTWSFGISVCLFVFGGAVCMNPAMVLAQCIVGLVPWGNCIPFMLADMLGGFVGATALMIVFGVGVHCDTVLKGTKYQGSGHMFAITTWSFGISVCLFVFGGAVCMNPAMVLAQCIVGLVPWSSCIPFMIADMLGGFVGAVIAWFMYADEFKASEGVVDPIAQRNIFSTNPTTEGTNYARNFFCEAICTFVFISAILAAASRAGENVLMLAICVGLIVWAVGMGMGGITGFAMNQARDLGPRMAYQVLPIKNKADNNWKYGLLVPGIAPFVGAALAALFVHGFLGMF